METQVVVGFSERFEQIKARFKLRNRDLSRIAGVSDNAIAKIVKGQTEAPDVRTLVTLGRKLNLSADWLLFGEGPMVKEEPDGSLKKGLQLRDELIAQLQKELWGKSEGATDQPALLKAMTFEEKFRLYHEASEKLMGVKMPIDILSSLSEPGSKVGGTPLTYAVNTVRMAI
jgi:transcriptional regulator with XRE-family HTH domain